MKANEVRGKEDSELLFEIKTLEKELFDMRFRSMTEGIANPARIKALRRNVARMKTILQERQLGVAGQETR
ncbi:MAG: 50S ribosomal protein L29 [Planctomycetota bacterium]|jgi:large subunit ribosomal protein L29|nr:50S ribosomal protein L29 [Planctomycetota bacterium]